MAKSWTMSHYDTALLNDLSRADEAAWLWDPDQCRVVWANDAGVAFWGAEGILDLLDRRFARAESGVVRMGELARSLNDGETLEELFCFPSVEKGRKVRCRCSLFALRDRRNGLLVVAGARADSSGVASDITPAVFNRIPYPLAVFGGDGALLLANDAAAGLFCDKAGARDLDSLAAILGDEDTARRFIERTLKAGLVSESCAVHTLQGERVHRVTASRLNDDEARENAVLAIFDDITERRRYEVDLNETVARLSDFAAAAADFTFELDADLRISELSKDFDDLGLSPAAQWVGRPWSDLPLRCDDGIEVDLADAMARQLPFRATLHWSGASPSVSLCWSAVPVLDAHGRFAGYRGIGARARPPASAHSADGAADLADQEALDAEDRVALASIARTLRESCENRDAPAAGAQADDREAPAAPDPLEQLRLMFDQTPAAVLVHRKFKLLYANRAAARMLGHRSAKKMIQDADLFALFEGAGKSLKQAHNSRGLARKNAKRRKTLTLKAADGTDETRKLTATIAPVQWAGGEAVQVLLEKALPRAKAKSPPPANRQDADLRAILDTVTDGILTLDGRGRIETANAGAETIFGFAAGDIVGRKLTSLMAKSSVRIVNAYLKSLGSGDMASILNDGREVVAVEKMGGEIPLFLTLGRLPVARQDTGGRLCAVIRDITQWKTTERELRKAKEQAEQANSLKSEFLARTSHELRTPLNAIIGFAEVMREEKIGPLPSERYRGYVDDIHASGEHLLSLINDLLDLSKIEAGKQDPEFVSVDLKEIIKQSVSLMQPHANRERVIIRSSVSEGLPTLLADKRNLHQILLNLLSNAVKFTKPGGQVIVTANLDEDGAIQLVVRDTGIGMSSEEIARALEPFNQISNPELEQEPGTGLGLPLTKALAEANKARFHIESDRETGTMVQITFPKTQVLAK